MACVICHESCIDFSEAPSVPAEEDELLSLSPSSFENLTKWSSTSDGLTRWSSLSENLTRSLPSSAGLLRSSSSKGLFRSSLSAETLPRSPSKSQVSLQPSGRGTCCFSFLKRRAVRAEEEDEKENEEPVVMEEEENDEESGVIEDDPVYIEPAVESPIVANGCGHVFHRSCLYAWAQSSTSSGDNRGCPRCHEPMDLENLTNLNLEPMSIIKRNTACGPLISMSLNQYYYLKEGSGVAKRVCEAQLEEARKQCLEDKKQLERNFKEECDQQIRDLIAVHEACLQNLRSELKKQEEGTE